MKKIVFITFLILSFSNVKALSLNDITKELKETSTYQMYQNMGSTKVTNDNNKITIKYPSIKDDKVINTVTYILKNNTLENTFKGDINNRYDVLDNNEPWTLEIIDIIAKLNGNNNKEILSINEDYLKSTNFNDDKLEVKYSDYSIKDLPMIPLKSTSYLNIKENCDLTIKYLKNMGEQVDSNEYQSLLSELKNTIILLNSDRENKELQEDFLDIKLALNEFIAEHVQNSFDRLLNTNTTLSDMVNYLNEKTLNLEMYSYSNSRKK